MPFDGAIGRDLIAPARPSLFTLWSNWRRRAAERRQAATWSERELRDLGLTQGDVWRTLHQPLTSPATDPRPRNL